MKGKYLPMTDSLDLMGVHSLIIRKKIPDILWVSEKSIYLFPVLRIQIHRHRCFHPFGLLMQAEIIF